jgi:hypothetical protein
MYGQQNTQKTSKHCHVDSVSSVLNPMMYCIITTNLPLNHVWKGMKLQLASCNFTPITPLPPPTHHCPLCYRSLDNKTFCLKHRWISQYVMVELLGFSELGPNYNICASFIYWRMINCTWHARSICPFYLLLLQVKSTQYCLPVYNTSDAKYRRLTRS